MAFLRVMVLLWADMLAAYVMWIMQTYLTDVWKLGFTHAAGIMNVANGLAKVLPFVFFFIVDSGLGNYWMLLLSSISYVIGLGFLSISTPPVLANPTGTCKDYKPQCIGHTQKALFYTALALIAVGISGHIVSLVALFVDQFQKKKVDPKVRKPKIQFSPFSVNEIRRKQGGAKDEFPFQPPSVPINQNRRKADSAEDDMSQLQFQPVEAMLALVTREKVKIFRACLVVLFPVIGLIAFPYIKPWSIRFGIPAICTLVAVFAFLLGSHEYKDSKSKGSPVTNVFRVLLASTLKMLHKLPNDNSELYETELLDVQKLPHTSGLRFLDKAAIKEGPGNNRWRLCTVTEVEETKIIINMVPIWITFIICGVVTSIGSTYFVEQGNHMNFKVGKLKLPNSILLVLYEIAKSQSKFMYTFIASYLGGGLKRYAPPVGIAIATLFSVLCCIVAALVETRRIHVIKDHGLLDKPDEKIPMTVFWLLPQYILLAGLDSFYENSVAPFLSNQSPPSMKRYLVYFNPGLSGIGIMGSVLSVFVVGRVSQRRGKHNWFQYTLNRSRLDNYYWTLAVLSAANFFWFLAAALWYPYWEPTSNDEEETGNAEGIAEAIGNIENIIPSIEETEDTHENETSGQA